MPECIIPAAGASSRMGSWKLLLPWGHSTIIETVVSNVLAAGLGVIVVAGYRGAELHDLLDGRPGVTVVDNHNWEEGMAGSVAGAIASLRSAASSGSAGEPFLVLPADMPWVGPELIRTLLAARTANDHNTVLFAACDGRAGHPVLIPASLIPAIQQLPKGARIRELLMAQPFSLVETGDPAVLQDIDTPEDYKKLS